MDGSLDWGWLNYDYKHLVELYPDETWEKMRPEVKKKSRLNPCPSNPETWKILYVYETRDDVMDVLSGDHFTILLDEMYQESRGSRWAVCPLCRGKDPVRLRADFANRLAVHVIEKCRIPIMSGGMLLREHQGWYKNIYQAIDMIDSRDKIVIYNWSEGYIRRGGMRLRTNGFWGTAKHYLLRFCMARASLRRSVREARHTEMPKAPTSMCSFRTACLKAPKSPRSCFC